MINEAIRMQQLAGIINEEQKMTFLTLKMIKDKVNSDAPMVIISGNRGENSMGKNSANNKRLRYMANQLGYETFFVDGYWIENKGKENETHVAEESLLIFGKVGDNNKLKEVSKAWAKKFKQESFIIVPEDSNIAYLIESGGREIRLGKFHPRVIGQAYTKLRDEDGSVFTFADSD